MSGTKVPPGNPHRVDDQQRTLNSAGSLVMNGYRSPPPETLQTKDKRQRTFNSAGSLVMSGT